MTAGLRPRYSLGLIPCSSSKNQVPRAMAALLYRGTVFMTMMKHAQQRCDWILIMSAQHGLILPSKEIDYYNTYLGDLSPMEKVFLALKISEQWKEWKQQTNPTTVLSYLPTLYHDLWINSIGDTSGISIHQPYVIRTPTQVATLTREIKNHGLLPPRR